MANVLGNLFGDIADAIREKNGETATMKPAAFAEAIRAIQVGGGSGEGMAVTFTAGERTIASSETTGATFTHNLGVMPDVMVITTYGDVADKDIRCMLVLSQYAADLCPSMEYATIVAAATGSCLMKGGYDNFGGASDVVYEMMGGPMEVTENSFKIGTTNHTLATRRYTYFVLGRSAQ